MYNKNLEERIYQIVNYIKFIGIFKICSLNSSKCISLLERKKKTNGGKNENVNLRVTK